MAYIICHCLFGVSSLFERLKNIIVWIDWYTGIRDWLMVGHLIWQQDSGPTDQPKEGHERSLPKRGYKKLATRELLWWTIVYMQSCFDIDCYDVRLSSNTLLSYVTCQPGSVNSVTSVENSSIDSTCLSAQYDTSFCFLSCLQEIF